MGANALIDAPKETSSKELTETEPSGRPGVINRMAEFMFCGTFRTLSWSLGAAPRAARAAYRMIGSPATEAEVRQLEAGSAVINPTAVVESPYAEGVMDIKSEQLEKGALQLVHALREDLGDWMRRDGEVVMSPQVDDTHDVTVKTTAHDSGVAHRTEAIIDIAEKNGGHQALPVAHVAVETIEPTIGAKHADSPAEPVTYINGFGVGIWNPEEALQSVQMAIDQGDVPEIEFVEAA